MNHSRSFSFARLEQVAAFVLLIVCLPGLLVVALLIYLTGGRPILLTPELPARDNSAAHNYRFRTTGHGTPAFHVIGRFLRTAAIDEIPRLWSVLRGDIRMKELLRPI